MSTRKKQPRRVFPANLYDALDFSALAFGGIGSGHAWNEGLISNEAERTPCCMSGHAQALTEIGTYGAFEMLSSVLGQGRVAYLNDAVVPSGKRISFALWCKRLNVVRGE